MSRQFNEKELVLATHNNGKIQEFRHLFNEINVKIVDVGIFNWMPPEETGGSFWENSLIKAKEATRLTGMVSLADDSGLCVDVLGGAPGIYSADWALKSDGSRDFNFAIDKLIGKIKKLNNQEPLTAHFICSLVLCWPDGHFEKFEGRKNGKIIWPARGQNGHGYDPVFLPDGYRETFGEMDRWNKNRISHRGLAVTNMINTCFKG